MTVAKLLKHDFAKGDLKLYNSNGNVTYYETSNGAWYKYEYNSNGNQTYYENSNGYWVKSEYNSNGNQTYYEDSKGYWYKYKFDSNGKRIYYENSKGDITDNRPKANSNGKTVIIDGIEYELKAKNQ
jgi:hypothetical protein